MSTNPRMQACMICLGENVHILRQRERRSQKALAAQIGCSPVSISNLECGKLKTISLEHLIAYSLHFGVSIDSLISKKLSLTFSG